MRLRLTWWFLTTMLADFSSMQAVRDFAETSARDYPRLDLLVNKLRPNLVAAARSRIVNVASGSVARHETGAR